MNKKMPVIFLAHGSPMNIILDNVFTHDLKKLGKELPKPEAVMVISAHWLTKGTFVTADQQTKQIYDFYGFPKKLYEFKYNCPAAPVFADLTRKLNREVEISPSLEWGLDHASWSVLKYIYPEADVPVYELSIDITKNTEYHYEIAKGFKELRENGVMIIGSGNIVHNLSMMDFNDDAEPADWVIEIDEKFKNCLLANDHKSLIDFYSLGENAAKAVPARDHYLPMIYILGIQNQDDRLRFIHEGYQNKTMSMRSFILEE